MVYFSVIAFVLVEVPLIGYLIKPEKPQHE
jgi:hypothetical protein